MVSFILRTRDDDICGLKSPQSVELLSSINPQVLGHRRRCMYARK